MTRNGPQTHIKANNNWIAGQDPGFEDLGKMDFRLKKDAAVFAKIEGFKPIPFEEMGLRGPVGPRDAKK